MNRPENDENSLPLENFNDAASAENAAPAPSRRATRARKTVPAEPTAASAENAPTEIAPASKRRAARTRKTAPAAEAVPAKNNALTEPSAATAEPTQPSTEPTPARAGDDASAPSAGIVRPTTAGIRIPARPPANFVPRAARNLAARAAAAAAATASASASAETSETPKTPSGTSETSSGTPGNSVFSFGPDDEISTPPEAPAENSASREASDLNDFSGSDAPRAAYDAPGAPSSSEPQIPSEPRRDAPSAPRGFEPSESSAAPRNYEPREPYQNRSRAPYPSASRAPGGNASAGTRPWERKERAPFPPRPSKFGGGKFNAQGKFERFRSDKAPAPRRSWGELAKTDSAEEATLSLGAEFDYNLLENEAFLNELSALARHVSKRAGNAPAESAFVAPAAVIAAVAADAAARISATAPENSDGAATGAEVAAENVSAEKSDASAEAAGAGTEAASTAVPSVPATALEPDTPAEPLDFNTLYESSMTALIATAKSFSVPIFRSPVRRALVKKILRAAFAARRPITIHGTLEMLADGNGLLLYVCDNYRVKELSAFVPKLLIKKFGLQRGHDLEAVAFPPMKGETAPIVVHLTSIMGADPATVKDLTPFTELTPYYPTERIILETDETATWNNLSMRCVDLLCPIGLGQRGLIVAPPRTGKTVLLQSMANAIAKTKPNAHLIVLLVDERPEEVTDFKRKTTHGEVISSTFDESPENHVHVAEMVIERARRMVELGKHVVILLDSITRLARAYNTLMPNGGKTLSGGVEAGALSKPKRFFGSARNIEGGGSLTILGTALIDTGSKMDEVIFEEFKGTGNMELDLDRDLANKRIYPAINFERSGTRKEELLYHPQEMQCVYSMRRAMKGVPSMDAMEMLISRMKKTRTNAEFLLTLAGR